MELSINLIFVVELSDGPGICACLITILSLLMVLATFPLSLLFTVKVVKVCLPGKYYHSQITGIFKEYERAVIFRLGRLLSGGARGPGIFFIIPCVDSYTKVDMRVVTYDVPPQEVSNVVHNFSLLKIIFQILTKDSVTVHVDAIMYYKVVCLSFKQKQQTRFLVLPCSTKWLIFAQVPALTLICPAYLRWACPISI